MEERRLRGGRRACGAFFVAAGVMHFVIPRRYEQIVPPRLPNAPLLVAVSGAAEIAGGAALLDGRLRRVSRVWLLALLAAVYPANIYMATCPQRFPRIPRWALLARLPLQFAIAWWVWVVTR
jgi:uncharacterized membrane protein